MSGDFTTAEDIIKNGAKMCRVSQKDIRRIVTLRSSGSSGAAKRLYFSAGDLERTIEYFRLGTAHICPVGAKAAIMLGSRSPDGLGALLLEGLSRLGAKADLFGSVSDYQAAAAFLRELQPDFIVAAPVCARRLALAVRELSPAAVLLSSDYVADSVREAVGRLWHTKVYSHYGLTESGLGLAVQCPALAGHHIRSDELCVEIIDPDTGEALPDGAWGEIVFTTLKREAMPLSRYRTGDISRLLDGACPCGNHAPRLDKILGRIDELKKPVNICALDELLLSSDDITDYSAVYDTAAERLSLSILGNIKTAETLMSKTFPLLNVVFSPADEIICTGKRHVELL